MRYFLKFFKHCLVVMPGGFPTKFGLWTMRDAEYKLQLGNIIFHF